MVSGHVSGSDRPITILVVEDNDRMQRTIRDILSLEEDFEIVACAYNGKEGVELYPRVRPDVTLMNYSMPEMNGIDATREIIEYDPDAVILMVSAYDDPRLIAAAFRAGVRGFFVKTNVVFEEFYATIRMVNEQRHANGAAAV